MYFPEEKNHVIKIECLKPSKTDVAKIREVARMIDLLVSTFLASEYGPLYYRELEKEKIVALKTNLGNFNALMSVTGLMKVDLR